MTFGAPGQPLILFSAPHLTAIAVIFLFCTLLIFFRKTLQDGILCRRVAFILAAAAIVQQILLYTWYACSGEWSLSWTLPLQLCDMSILLSVLVLITKNRILSELLYFWGIGGATQAILTPDMGSYSYPHFVFYQFFIAHGLIILTCVFMLLAYRFRPTLKSVIRTFVITNAYAAIILPVNALTGGNYLFLRYKPQYGSLMELLGPWPWYILWLEAVALLIFILLYLPFRNAENIPSGFSASAGH